MEFSNILHILRQLLTLGFELLMFVWVGSVFDSGMAIIITAIIVPLILIDHIFYREVV